MNDPQSETVLEEQNSLSLVSQTGDISQKYLEIYWKVHSSRLLMWKSFSEDRLGLLKVWTGWERPWRSSSSIHRPKPSWSLRQKDVFVHTSRLVTRSQHTWPDGEGVEVAPEDEVVVPSPIVNLQDAGGTGEQPGLARAVKSLAHSRSVRQKRPEYFLKTKSWSSLDWCFLGIKLSWPYV